MVRATCGQIPKSEIQKKILAEAIRATGGAKAEVYRLGVEALGTQGYTVMQLMQIVGDRNVRIVPDVAVSGAGANPGMVDGLLGLMLRNQINGGQPPKAS